MTATELAAPQTLAGAMSPHFDYSGLTSDLADKMRGHASRICEIRRASVLDVGRELIAAKGLVEHRCFAQWVRTACQMHIRTAERAMQAADLVQKNDNLSYLPPDGLLALASRSAPEPVISEIVEQIAAGARPSAADIKRRIVEVKKTKKRVREQMLDSDEPPDRKCDPAEQEAVTDKLIGMLRSWHRIDEFMAALEKADLSKIVEALRRHYDKSVDVLEPVLEEAPQTTEGSAKGTTGIVAAAEATRPAFAEPRLGDRSADDFAGQAPLPASPPATRDTSLQVGVETVALGPTQRPPERKAPAAMDDEIQGSPGSPDLARSQSEGGKLPDRELAQQAIPSESAPENSQVPTRDCRHARHGTCRYLRYEGPVGCIAHSRMTVSAETPAPPPAIGPHP